MSECNEVNDVSGVVKCQKVVKVVQSQILREIMEEAHMAGQVSEGAAEPSHRRAREYVDRLFGI